MSKRNNDGDVIANRISLLEAKGQKLLASLYGSRPDWDSADSATKPQDDDPDTALEAVVKGSLSTTSSKDLGLDHGVLSACTH